jgi:hypothetical protein
MKLKIKYTNKYTPTGTQINVRVRHVSVTVGMKNTKRIMATKMKMVN